MKVSLLCATAALAGCAPADVAGTYSGAVTNRENGCSLDNWTAGASTSGITMAVTQSGASVTTDVQGLARVVLDLFTGNSEPLRGEATGNGFFAAKNGTRAMQMGECVYTSRVEARATLAGNALEGTVTYRYQTNGVAACATLTACTSVQAFSFVRPPR
jgi:hypothetical protein